MSPLPHFLSDEFALSERIGTPLPPLRKFNLRTFGIEPGPFLRDLTPTFHELPWDLYDVKLAQKKALHRHFPDQEDRLQEYLKDAYEGRCGLEAVADLFGRLSPEDREAVTTIRPHRQRSVAGYVIDFDAKHKTQLSRVPIAQFAQNVSGKDVRSLGRRFAETSPEVTTHPGFEQWLGAVARMVYDLEQRRIRRVSYVLHQMRTLVRKGSHGEVVPEGVHQDGANYIVSALVVERTNVVGGESVVYGPDKSTELYRTTLQPGEGIFQADSPSPLWHFATPIRLDPEGSADEGSRGIFGLDINVER